MDEARRVLERLERIERLRDDGGPQDALLGEVRKLLEEGEAWLAAEQVGTGRAREALEACRRRLDDPSAGRGAGPAAHPSAERALRRP